MIRRVTAVLSALVCTLFLDLNIDLHLEAAMSIQIEQIGILAGFGCAGSTVVAERRYSASVVGHQGSPN
jgi:hypothetical protein